MKVDARHTFNRRVPQAAREKLPKVLGIHNASTGEPMGYCVFGTCTTQVAERLLICREDVGKVPDDLLDAYYATYRRGQNPLTASADNKVAYAAVMAFCASLLPAAEGAAS